MKETITKNKLALAVAEITDCQKMLAERMVADLFAAMREELIKGNRIEIRGFGVLQAKLVKAQPAARNPRTGEIIYVPARRKTHFKPGRRLKQGLHEPPTPSDNGK